MLRAFSCPIGKRARSRRVVYTLGHPKLHVRYGLHWSFSTVVDLTPARGWAGGVARVAVVVMPTKRPRRFSWRRTK